ncbi:potassium translocating ATPase, subunit A [uncultured Desulfobacterium sp.]|uniref:Potassium-transporting ATPase potassium-binding subunit n=1 Tax=uncultured Desulfobacterium sp. TaxID=201089 RepID=A0A445MUQ1_9BACT|nr:potassium translocating ATPase, subunit A [uncultured Desulfobacterium sp.]
MSTLLILLILGAAALLSWPAAKWMTWAMSPPQKGTGFRYSTESVFLRIGGQTAARDQNWKEYTLSLLLFNSFMFIVVFVILSLQQILPLNPDSKGVLEPSLIFHTAASFTSNTNLQHYSGEVSLSYFSQIFGLMWLQFVSAATGIASLAALARGLSGKTNMGNFFSDLMRATFLVLLPMAVLASILLILGGVPMTLLGAATAKTLEGSLQIIARGPVAAFVAIKQLGTNGGGFFSANSAHPFENPSFFTNIIECVCIILIPMAGVWMFGRITGRMRHAVIIFSVMAVLLAGKVALAVYFESAPTAAFAELPVQATGNIEGKELRFGAVAGATWGVLTTATSNGSVNSMHDSFNPLTGLILLAGMWLNITFGGVGVGLINMFLYIIVGVFICGMMVGRTPEYLGRKVETHEMKLALLTLLVHPLFILGGTAVFALTPWGASTVNNPGPHGFTEILYEFSSAAANNGSGFEGLRDNTTPWNVATGIIMLLARFIPIILPLAIAGSLAGRKPAPVTTGTLRTDTFLFGMVILGSVIFIGALLFLPVAVLGPVAEYLAK